jgi:DNA-directed RNA polymerase specialized sigma subunit
MSVDHGDKPGSLTQDAAQDNERLVRAIVAGDREAEKAFAERYLRPVKAMLLARSRNPDVAADLLQDVMIEAICALRRGQLREPAKLSSFVIAIARNRLNNHFRSSVIAQRLQLNPDVVRQRKLRATRRVIDFVRRQSQTDSSDHIVVGKVT